MGANSARHTLEILDNVRYVIAIELLTAAQAIDLRENGAARLGRGTSIAYSVLRKRVKFLEHDKETTSDIESLSEMIQSEEMLDSVRRSAGFRMTQYHYLDESGDPGMAGLESSSRYFAIALVQVVDNASLTELSAVRQNSISQTHLSSSITAPAPLSKIFLPLRSVISRAGGSDR